MEGFWGDFTWRVPDCEELVWSVTGDDGVGFLERDVIV